MCLDQAEIEPTTVWYMEHALTNQATQIGLLLLFMPFKLDFLDVQDFNLCLFFKISCSQKIIEVEIVLCPLPNIAAFDQCLIFKRIIRIEMICDAKFCY